MSFNVGDRAVVNALFDPNVPAALRDRMVGAYGTVAMVVDENFGMLFFTPDREVADYPGGGDWAVLAHELDKLEG